MITVTTNLENCKKNDWTKKTHKYQTIGKRQKAKGTRQQGKRQKAKDKRHKAYGNIPEKGSLKIEKMKLMRKG